MKLFFFQEKATTFFKKPSVLWCLALTILSLYIRYRYFFHVFNSSNGLPKMYDSYWYLDHAYALLNDLSIDRDFNGIFYIGYYGLLAVMLFIFKSETAFVVFQVGISALSVILVYSIAETIFGRRTAIIAGIIFIFSRQLSYWSVYILTDSLFVTMLLVIVYLIIKIGRSYNKIYRCLLVFCLAYTAVLRPAGAITVIFILAYMLQDYGLGKLLKMIRKRPILFVACLIITVSACGVAAYKCLKSPLGMSFYWNLRWLLYGNYSAGQLFDIPSPYDHKFGAIKNDNFMDNFVLSFYINNWHHILVLYIKRFISFWGELWVWNYRAKNMAEAFIYLKMLMPILIMFIGMCRAIFGKTSRQSIILFVPVIATVFFCLIFFIDCAWRYRIPALPFTAMFTAYGLDLIIMGCFALFKKYIASMLKWPVLQNTTGFNLWRKNMN